MGIKKAISAMTDSASGISHGINDAGLALIKEFEGFRANAYPDPGSGGEPWTIGYGTTVYPSGRKVRKGDSVTSEEAEAYLLADVAEFERAVRAAIKAPTTSNQFSALVSFCYNVGAGNLRSSTLLRKHNAGDYTGAKAEFAKWRLASGKVMNGLVRRREAEAELYDHA